jgi:hypothetical protein
MHSCWWFFASAPLNSADKFASLTIIKMSYNECCITSLDIYHELLPDAVLIIIFKLLYNVTVLDHFWPPVVPCWGTWDAVLVVNSFLFTISTTCNYNHSQLFIMLLRVYTITILTRQYSILFSHSLHNTLDILHMFTLPVSVSNRELTLRIDFLKTDPVNSLLKTDSISPMAFRRTPLHGHRWKRSLYSWAVLAIS